MNTLSAASTKQPEFQHLIEAFMEQAARMEDKTSSIKSRLQQIHYTGEEKSIPTDVQSKVDDGNDTFISKMHLILRKVEIYNDRLNQIDNRLFDLIGH